MKKRAKSGVSQAVVALHLDISQPRVAQFVAEKVFKKLADGSLDLDECRLKYIRWLRDETRKSSASASAGRAQDARAREIELKMARQERELIPLAGAIFVIDELAAATNIELKNLPSRFTRDMAERKRLELAVASVRTGIADKMARAAAALRTQ